MLENPFIGSCESVLGAPILELRRGAKLSIVQVI